MKGKKMQENAEREQEDGGLFRITAKAAVIGPDGRVLVLTRATGDTRKASRRDLPGGHVNAAETPEETLRREVKEETGLTVGEIVPLPLFRRFDGDREADILALRFVTFTDETETTLDPAEHSASSWMTLDEAAKTFKTQGYERDKHETVLLTQEYLRQQDALGGWKRCLADFENYKKRQEASQKEMGQYLVERLLNDLVPVLDNFHAAASHVPEESKDSPWVVGIGYIEKQLEDTLAQHGVRVIEVKEGDLFDPSCHEALSDSSTEGENNGGSQELKIEKILQNGYMIGDKVVRAAKVSVRYQ